MLSLSVLELTPLVDVVVEGLSATEPNVQASLSADSSDLAPAVEVAFVVQVRLSIRTSYLPADVLGQLQDRIAEVASRAVFEDASAVASTVELDDPSAVVLEPGREHSC